MFSFPALNFLGQNVLRYITNMPLKVKIFHIYVYYPIYKHLYTLTLNLDEAFLLSVGISWARRNRVVTPLFVKNHFFTKISLFSTYTCPGKMISSYHLK